MPAFSTVPPALSSKTVPVSSVSSVSLASLHPTAAPTSFLESLSQPSLSPPSQIPAASLPPQPSLNHIVIALRGNITTHPTPGTSTTPSLISSTSKPNSGSSSNKWLPGVIVAGIVAVIAAAALATWLTFRRRRRQRYEQARQHDPQLTPDQFRRRSHMSEAALMAEAERERRNIIRKSIMSRSSASLSYLGAVGEVAGDQGAQASDEMEEGYRGVPLYQRQPVPRPPLQPQPQPQTQPPTHPSTGQCDLAHDHENEPHGASHLHHVYTNDNVAALETLETLAPLATSPLIPAPLNVSPPASAAAPQTLRDDYKEWTAALRRHTSRVADRHPHLTLDNVAEESESGLDQPLVGDAGGVDNDRPASPPIPPRSRLRPLSVVLPDATGGDRESAHPLRQDSTASQANGFMARQVHADPRNTLAHPNDATTTSPTSLYSVDFSQVGVSGGERRRSAGR